MKLTEMSTELVLQTLLAETITTGLQYAFCLKDHEERNKNNKDTQYNWEYHRINEGINCAANIFASILPDICPSQVEKTFHQIINDDLIPCWRTGLNEENITTITQMIQKS